MQAGARGDAGRRRVQARSFGRTNVVSVAGFDVRQRKLRASDTDVGAASERTAVGRAGTSVFRTRSARLHFLPLQQMQPREMEPYRATMCVLVQN
jgi:hypothetical protein